MRTWVPVQSLGPRKEGLFYHRQAWCSEPLCVLNLNMSDIYFISFPVLCNDVRWRSGLHCWRHIRPQLVVCNLCRRSFTIPSICSQADITRCHSVQGFPSMMIKDTFQAYFLLWVLSKRTDIVFLNSPSVVA